MKNGFPAVSAIRCIMTKLFGSIVMGPFAMFIALPPAYMVLMTVIVWFISSIPVYLAAKMVAEGRASVGKAMIATLVGPIVFGLTLALSNSLFGLLFESFTPVIAFLAAFLMWIATYKVVFDVGWLGGFAIALLSAALFIVLMLLLTLLAHMTVIAV